MATHETRLSQLITAIGTDYKTIRTWLFGSAAGTLAGLNTTDKTSLTAAINEVNAKPSGTPVDATTAVKGVVRLGTLTEHATGSDGTIAATVAGVRQERAAVKAEILGAATPATLDTLDELAAALGDDANFAATTSTALGNRVRFDAVQTLTAPQSLQARSNIAAVGTVDTGNLDADLVALYTAAKA